MRHRSVIAFILLAATLAAIPQASQDLLALKNALGERVRNEILFAFLNLNPQDGATVSGPQRARLSQPSCPSSAKSVTQTASNSKKPGSAAATAPSVESKLVLEVSDKEFGQLAMMLAPPADAFAERSHLESPERFDGLVLGQVLKMPARELPPVQELSMIIPPSEGLDPVPPPRRQNAVQAKSAKARQNLSAEWEARASFVAARYAAQSEELKKAGETIRFQFVYDLKDGKAIRIPAPATRVRATKLRTRNVKTVTPPIASAPRQLKQLAYVVAGPRIPAAPEVPASE
jgi:hypothetical protein